MRKEAEIQEFQLIQSIRTPKFNLGTQADGIRYPVPPLACDCHFHVFGPPQRYPGVQGHSYLPREAPLEAWQASFGAIGLQRAVVVQPSCYGVDNACSLAAMKALGPLARGVASIHQFTPAEELHRLNASGMRGVRLNAKSIGDTDLGKLKDLIRHLAERITALGWHLQLHAELATVVGLLDTLTTVGVPVVLDHMAGARAGDNLDDLAPVLNALRQGHCWVKLSGAYRVSQLDSGFHDSIRLAQALIGANPDRVVWGSDWPHTGTHPGRPQDSPKPIPFRNIDAPALLDLLAEQAGDIATFKRILVDNPARLYGFGIKEPGDLSQELQPTKAAKASDIA
jgi:predicted TIM-barrel fold metal-dependent hydrolase